MQILVCQLLYHHTLRLDCVLHSIVRVCSGNMRLLSYHGVCPPPSPAHLPPLLKYRSKVLLYSVLVCVCVCRWDVVYDARCELSVLRARVCLYRKSIWKHAGRHAHYMKISCAIHRCTFQKQKQTSDIHVFTQAFIAYMHMYPICAVCTCMRYMYAIYAVCTCTCSDVLLQGGEDS